MFDHDKVILAFPYLDRLFMYLLKRLRTNFVVVVLGHYIIVSC